MSFDVYTDHKYCRLLESQSLSNRAMSFDINTFTYHIVYNLSQSLSNRAMSFDRRDARVTALVQVSIPFEQGDVFRPFLLVKPKSSLTSQSLSNRAMSFDMNIMDIVEKLDGLNPFRTGRCLSTKL